MTSSYIDSMSLSGFYLIVAVDSHVQVYDLRNFQGPLQQNEASTNYRIKCVRSFSHQGDLFSPFVSFELLFAQEYLKIDLHYF